MPGLALSHLSLSHFRSHKSARLTPGPEPLAFFGPNGAGKTNILEAVSMLSPGRGIRRAAPEDLPRAPENLGWKIAAELESLGHVHEVETWAEAGGPRQVRIDDSDGAGVLRARSRHRSACRHHPRRRCLTATVRLLQPR